MALSLIPELLVSSKLPLSSEINVLSTNYSFPCESLSLDSAGLVIFPNNKVLSDDMVDTLPIEVLSLDTTDVLSYVFSKSDGLLLYKKSSVT